MRGATESSTYPYPHLKYCRRTTLVKCCISFFRFPFFNCFIFKRSSSFSHFLSLLTFHFSLFHLLPTCNILSSSNKSHNNIASRSPYPRRNISHRTNMDAKLPSSNKLARLHWSCGGQAFISASRSKCDHGRTAWKPRDQIRIR